MYYRQQDLKLIMSLLSFFIALLIIALVPQICYADEEDELIEINLDEPYDIPEGHEEDIYKNIDFVSIASEEKGKDFILILKNEGPYTVYDWSVAFNADFKALEISGAELVTDEQVLRFRNNNYFDAFEPGAMRKVIIKTDSDNHEVCFYRVYGVCNELSNEYIDSDYVQFIDEDGTATLKTVDDGEDIYSEKELQKYDEPITDSKYLINADAIDFRTGTYSVIEEDSRTRIRKVNVTPYKSIANLRATWRSDRYLARRLEPGL